MALVASGTRVLFGYWQFLVLSCILSRKQTAQKRKQTTTHPPLRVFIFHTNTNTKPPAAPSIYTRPIIHGDYPHEEPREQRCVATVQDEVPHTRHDLELKHTNPRPQIR
ncbi:hypothetical protein BS47DRAFT_1369719 [Hydnum rufescens UP504]|uniref:Uncharacterized protein n=1 Tax=Hydnum rufescens UP504 TaxID=1448309 RepID=A0A9P6ACI0_9AGAM|nr:hypothetical protein BS47DRAFT_1369719 [Hydnum rufescens UP504]